VTRAENLGVHPDDVHLLDGASHFLQEDRPGDIADLIGRFVLDQVARSQTA
jgi:hypothetical protein